MKNETVQSKMYSYLIANGMSYDQAERVMAKVKKEMTTTFNNWESPIDTYNEHIQNLIKYTVKSSALEWLNRHKPKAWFKPMFETS
jgi:endonuclease III